MIPTITAQRILESYDTVLLDAFGVLVYQKEAIPGAIDFIEKLFLAGIVKQPLRTMILKSFV